MSEHERILNVLGAVPGLHVVVSERDERIGPVNHSYTINIASADGHGDIAMLYTNDLQHEDCANEDIARIVNALISNWIEGENGYLNIAIDLLTAYRNEVNE